MLLPLFEDEKQFFLWKRRKKYVILGLCISFDGRMHKKRMTEKERWHER